MAGTGMLWQLVLLSLLGTVGSNTDTSCSGLCGQRPLINSIGHRVVGGMNARPGAWPWIISVQIVYWNGRYRHHMCGGSLIAPSWVLTAAHCFSKNESDLNKWRFVAGAWEIQHGWNYGPIDPKMQERKPIKIIPHERYHRAFQENDIALVQLDSPIRCGDVIRIACLPRPSEGPIKTTEKCAVAGWGYTREGGSSPRILQEAMVNMIDTKICNGSRWYYGYIHRHNLCAGYQEGKIDTCQGDSGGPLMCRDKDTGIYVVHGVTSWGTGCARAFRPGIYTSTWHFLDWIASKIGPGSVISDLPPRTTTPPPPTTTIAPPPLPTNIPTTAVTQRPWSWIPTNRPWEYKPWSYFFIRTTTTRGWVTRYKPWKRSSSNSWSPSFQPLAGPLPTGPSMYTALRPWISNPVMVKSQAVGPGQPVSLSFPKRLKLLMESMKSSRST
ncbi:acrosin-like [Antechinus flavipes]|uniref:acrosin-like n=1 Tax=Antechinus flavipes TaxID=38775 RepID=UPI0022354BA1|nr:acrosin-like [Antechinus flavipes]